MDVSGDTDKPSLLWAVAELLPKGVQEKSPLSWQKVDLISRNVHDYHAVRTGLLR